MRRIVGEVAPFVAGFVACAVAVRWSASSAPVPASGVAPSFLAASGGAASLADRIERARRSVVSLESLPRTAPGNAPREPGVVASGVIIDAGGFIATSHHALEGARRLRVRLWNGRVYEGAVVCGDYPSDLALIRIPAKGLEPCRFGDDRRLRVGDLVVAIGNPLGFHQSVSVGVVSALRREPLRVAGRVLGEMIQTDAAINQGSSGGGLFDSRGDLVGISAAIVTQPPGAGSVGLGFAIPVSRARPVLRAMMVRGWLPRPWLGIRYRSGPLPGFGLEPPGLFVEGVLPQGPAAAAGIVAGDRLLRIGDRRVRGEEDLFPFVERYRPGDEVEIEVERGGVRRVLRVRLGWSPRLGVQLGSC